jgi:hypothetical protein
MTGPHHANGYQSVQTGFKPFVKNIVLTKGLSSEKGGHVTGHIGPGQLLRIDCVDASTSTKVETRSSSLSDVGSFDENNDQMIKYPVSFVWPDCRVKLHISDIFNSWLRRFLRTFIHHLTNTNSMGDAMDYRQSQ